MFCVVFNLSRIRVTGTPYSRPLSHSITFSINRVTQHYVSQDMSPQPLSNRVHELMECSSLTIPSEFSAFSFTLVQLVFSVRLGRCVSKDFQSLFFRTGFLQFIRRIYTPLSRSANSPNEKLIIFFTISRRFLISH